MGDDRFPFPDRDSSLLIFQRDPCYYKVPADQAEAVFDDAWSTGVRQAKIFTGQYETLDMVEILERLGFSIHTEDTDYVMGNVRYFCEYLSNKNIVRLYRGSISLWAQKNGFDYEQARNIILAHEYFHYLEAKCVGWVSKRCVVPMLKIGSFRIGKTGVPALSEVAANAFANEYYKSYMTLNWHEIEKD